MFEDVVKMIGSGIIGGLAALAIERVRQQNRLRIAALDKRLEVHQEAYTRCHSLLVLTRYGTPQESFSYAKECSDWWVENRVYLSQAVATETDKLFCNVMERNRISVEDIFCQGKKALKLILAMTELPAMGRNGTSYGTQLTEPHDVNGGQLGHPAPQELRNRDTSLP